MHLSPEHESTLAELLPRTTMPVVQVTARTRIEPNHVYVIPPAASWPRSTASSRRRAAGGARRPHGRRPVLPHAGRHPRPARGGHRAVRRRRRRRDRHQAHQGARRPDDRAGPATRPSTPACRAAAIATGMVDWVLPVRADAGAPARVLPAGAAPQAAAEEGPQPARRRSGRQPARGRAARGAALSCAAAPAATSPTTSAPPSCGASRGACRSTASTTCGAYLDCLRTRPGEAGALLQDLLISVTNFFRDRDCFEALEAQIPELFSEQGAGRCVRVWVPACATGEEAYSIAMLLREHARTLDAPPLVQIFAPTWTKRRCATRATALYPTTIEADVSRGAAAPLLRQGAARLPRAARDCARWCCSPCTTC